jgi:hypothetical protein
MNLRRATKMVACLLCIGVVMWMPLKAQAATAVYQYSIQNGDRTIYLWIPPACLQIRGVIVAFKNLTEQRWLEDPVIRSSATDECLGVVWIGEGKHSDLSADMGQAAQRAFLQMMHDLADTSGFPEMENAPILAMGHSAHGQFAWKFAQWAHERTIASIPIKTVPLPADLDLDGVPLLYLVGQTTEWPQFRDARIGDRDFFWPNVRRSALRLRTRDESQKIAVAVDPGGGHFDWSEQDARVVALFIRRACDLRLPPRGATSHAPLKLRSISFDSGWLMDTGGMNPDQYAAAPVKQYAGVKKEAYWVFDQSMASAIEALQGDRQVRRKQMLSFSQNDQVLPVAQEGFAALRFIPDDDGITFSLNPVFLDAVPDRLVGAGTPLSHGSSPIKLSVITGPIEQIGPYKFSYAESREAGIDGWIEEQAEADATYRKAVQPGKIHTPPNADGAEQEIQFAPLRDRRVGDKAIRLAATASSGLPVRFYVLSGPARVDGDRLIFSEVPKAGASQIAVHVVAYQAGRPPEKDKSSIKAAKPVERSFFLSK